MIHAAEIIERAELAELHAAATPAVRARLGLQLLEIGGALVSVGAHLPASAIVINRTIASAPLEDAGLQQIVDTYRTAGVERYFLQVVPDTQTSGFEQRLAQTGLKPARGWQKFVRGREAPPQPRTDLAIREIGAPLGADFARIACAAFDLGDAAVAWLANIAGRPNWHVFMSFDGDRPAGVGGLFVQGGIAWLDFGATAPEFRQRGSQSALLAARIDRALTLGCERMYTCTGVAVEGDPQHSYKNILRAGFRTDYIRDNYQPL